MTSPARLPFLLHLVVPAGGLSDYIMLQLRLYYKRKKKNENTRMGADNWVRDWSDEIKKKFTAQSAHNIRTRLGNVLMIL
jgi:hypothetical protein